MRQYYEVKKPGSLTNLLFSETEVPGLEKGKVLVAVKAIGLNYADIFAIMGLYSATPKGTFIPGLEFCGVVLHSDSSLYAKGDRVIGVTRFGGYDSHINADPDYLMPLPTDWTYEEGAAFPVQTLTAFYAIKNLGDLKKDQTVLIHSAAGGVGLQANRIAKRTGAYTIGVVGNEKKFSVLKDEGYDGWILRNPKTFSHDIKKALDGRPLNLVLEASGGKFFQYSYEALAPMGRLVAYGSAEFTPLSHKPNYIKLAFQYLLRPRIDPLSMITANKSVMAFNLIWLYERKALMHELLGEIDGLKLPPPKVGHKFPFNEISAALNLFKSGNTIGKVVLTIP